MNPHGLLRARLINYEHFRLKLLRCWQEQPLLYEGGVLHGMVKPLVFTLLLLMLL